MGLFFNLFLLYNLKMVKVKAYELRTTKVTGGSASKLSKIKVIRKSIARVNTVMSQKQRDTLRKHFGKKPLPLDLRAKKTRAIRRRLTQNQKHRTTLRQQKK